jgi:hypothetical protein
MLVKKRGKIFLFTQAHKKERETEKEKDMKRTERRSLRKREPPHAVKVINHHCFLA